MREQRGVSEQLFLHLRREPLEFRVERLMKKDSPSHTVI